MKYFKRCLSLLLCFALLFGLCSVNVFAEELTQKKVHVVLRSTSAGVTFGQTDVLEGETGAVTGEVYHSLNTDIVLSSYFIIANVDGSILLPAGDKYSITLDNITYRADLYDDGGGLLTSRNYGEDLSNDLYIIITFSDGSVSWLHSGSIEDLTNSGIVNFAYNSEKQTNTLKYTIKSDRDILKVEFREALKFNYSNQYNNAAYLQPYAGFDYPLKITIEKEDKSIGLLEGIWNGITDLGNKISNGFTELGNKVTTGFTNMVNGIKDVFNAIKDLPAKIWEFIENGLKSLFVPDEEYMSGYSDKWDSLMASRFGALYEVGDIVVTSWGDIQLADQTDSIQIPEVCLNLPDNCSFTFGGYDVTIVPDGFDVLVNALKLIISLTATYLFINGLIKRYDEIMGVEQ